MHWAVEKYYFLFSFLFVYVCVCAHVPFIWPLGYPLVNLNSIEPFKSLNNAFVWGIYNRTRKIARKTMNNINHRHSVEILKIMKSISLIYVLSLIVSFSGLSQLPWRCSNVKCNEPFSSGITVRVIRLPRHFQFCILLLLFADVMAFVPHAPLSRYHWNHLNELISACIIYNCKMQKHSIDQALRPIYIDVHRVNCTHILYECQINCRMCMHNPKLMNALNNQH